MRKYTLRRTKRGCRRSLRRSSRQTAGAAGNNMNNVQSRARLNSIEHSKKLIDLQEEFMQAAGIPSVPGKNYATWNTQSAPYRQYIETYKRDPLSNAYKYSEIIAKKEKENPNTNMLNIKDEVYKKIIQPNPLKRLYKRIRGNSSSRK